MRYKLFGRTGLRVSEVALGTGTFGTAWGSGMERAQARTLFEHFVEQGGNFIDCADGYQGGESEQMLGEFLHGQRANLVVATKYTTAAGARSILKTGNSRHAMQHALEQSLRRLRTEYVDILWVHFPDHVTPAEEILRGFDDLVRAGKVLHAGFSDFPAWRVSRAAAIAELRGWCPVSAVQVEYSLAERSAERELLPMAGSLGLSVLIWSALGGGLLTGKYRRGETGRRESGFGAGALKSLDPARERPLLDAIDAAARELGATPAQVAIAWVRAKGQQSGVSYIPILGARRLEQLQDNLGALAVELPAPVLAQLDGLSAIAPGFPHEFIHSDALLDAQSGGYWQQLDRPGAPTA